MSFIDVISIGTLSYFVIGAIIAGVNDVYTTRKLIKNNDYINFGTKRHIDFEFVTLKIAILWPLFLIRLLKKSSPKDTENF